MCAVAMSENRAPSARRNKVPQALLRNYILALWPVASNGLHEYLHATLASDTATPLTRKGSAQLFRAVPRRSYNTCRGGNEDGRDLGRGPNQWFATCAADVGSRALSKSAWWTGYDASPLLAWASRSTTAPFPGSRFSRPMKRVCSTFPGQSPPLGHRHFPPRHLLRHGHSYTVRFTSRMVHLGWVSRCASSSRS